MPIMNKRVIDEQIRLPLPLPMRQQLRINFKDTVVWYHQGDKVIIRSGGKAIGLTGQITTRVDDVGKVPIPRAIQELGCVPGMEVELTCDDDQISFPTPVA